MYRKSAPGVAPDTRITPVADNSNNGSSSKTTHADDDVDYFLDNVTIHQRMQLSHGDLRPSAAAAGAGNTVTRLDDTRLLESAISLHEDAQVW